jgi:hypothetical protein
MTMPTAPPRPAVVTRWHEKTSDPDQYLLLTPAGAAVWTPDPAAATSFGSMLEATRAAARLPCALRAFGMPFRSAAVLAASTIH